MKYRKKTVLVEAEQWWPNKVVAGVYPGLTYTVEDADGERIINEGWYVITIHGDEIKVAPGDWVITEPDGVHHYPCKPDIFAATYEAVE